MQEFVYVKRLLSSHYLVWVEPSPLAVSYWAVYLIALMMYGGQVNCEQPATAVVCAQSSDLDEPTPQLIDLLSEVRRESQQSIPAEPFKLGRACFEVNAPHASVDQHGFNVRLVWRCFKTIGSGGHRHDFAFG